MSRKVCAICRGNFTVPKKAKHFETRQLCLPCRKVFYGQKQS